MITFQPLGGGAEQVEAVARKELSELAAREGLAAAGIQITWTDQLVRAIARGCYDHRFGTRPFQRVIEKHRRSPACWRVANAKVPAAKLQLDFAEDGSVVVKTKP